MKQYRLKESVEKYFTLHNKNIASLEWWERENVTIEALEEVNPRIEIIIKGGGDIISRLEKKKHIDDWTEQERQDIEWFLNLGGFKALDKYAHWWFCEYDRCNSVKNFSNYIDEYLKKNNK